MPRQARIVFPNLPYYITQWGNRREDVFFTDDDRIRYLAWLKEYSDKHGVEILAYCLMTNQIHLVAVPRTEEALQRVLRSLHTRFAQRLNREQGWKGHVWHGRFSSSALDNAYMLAAIRYVERNPVRVKVVRKAERYRWSSAAAHCGLTEDAVLTKKRQWQRKMEQRLDWSAWLAEGDYPEQLDVISTHVERGLPCGSRQFIKKLERLSGQVLEYRPRGRPKKVR
jgi:putative transposase